MKALAWKRIYNKVLSQAISESGRILFIGNNFGDIFYWNLDSIKDASNRQAVEYASVQPVVVISLKDEPINSLLVHGKLVIFGTVGFIYVYFWDEEKMEMSEHISRIKIPSQNFESVEVNYMLRDKTTKSIYAACGDNMFYEIDLISFTMKRSFSGHTDYIHCMAVSDSNIISASEDGSILFWDLKVNQTVGKIEPYRNTDIARAKFGKWQGAVSVENGWLVCGGGPKSSIWHQRSMQCIQILPFPEKVHCSELFDDLIVIGGEHKYLHQYNFNGDILSEGPISGPSVYCIALQNTPVKFMSVAGASECLDIYTNFNFRDMVVHLCIK